MGSFRIMEFHKCNGYEKGNHFKSGFFFQIRRLFNVFIDPLRSCWRSFETWSIPTLLCGATIGILIGYPLWNLCDIQKEKFVALTDCMILCVNLLTWHFQQLTLNISGRSWYIFYIMKSFGSIFFSKRPLWWFGMELRTIVRSLSLTRLERKFKQIPCLEWKTLAHRDNRIVAKCWEIRVTSCSDRPIVIGSM